MAALNQDTRLVMTILFVGALSGTNVWAYAAFGMNFPYAHWHILFYLAQEQLVQSW